MKFTAVALIFASSVIGQNMNSMNSFNSQCTSICNEIGLGSNQGCVMNCVQALSPLATSAAAMLTPSPTPTPVAPTTVMPAVSSSHSMHSQSSASSASSASASSSSAAASSASSASVSASSASVSASKSSSSSSASKSASSGAMPASVITQTSFAAVLVAALVFLQ